MRIPCRGGRPLLGSSGVADCSRELGAELGADDDEGVGGRLGGRTVNDIGADMAAGWSPIDPKGLPTSRRTAQ